MSNQLKIRSATTDGDTRRTSRRAELAKQATIKLERDDIQKQVREEQAAAKAKLANEKQAANEAAAALKAAKPKIDIIKLEIAELQARIGADHPRIEKRQPRNLQRIATILPEIVGFDALLKLFESPTRTTKYAIRVFLRSGGVIPQVSSWCKQDGLEPGSALREALQKRLPLSPWSDTAAQALAQYLAHLAGLRPSEAEAQEHNPVLRRCVEYARSLQTKNQESYFDHSSLSEHNTLVFCSTILLLVYKDYAADAKDGFFAILLHSWLVRPMSAYNRERWESVYPVAAEKTSAEKDAEFKQKYKLWLEEKERLDAERVTTPPRTGRAERRISTAAAAAEAADQETSKQIEAKRSLTTVPDLSRFVPLVPAQVRNTKPVDPDDVPGKLGYINAIDIEPFSDSEKLLYLEGYLKYKEAVKYHSGVCANLQDIAEYMPRRSRAECVQYHYARKSHTTQPSKRNVEKRAAHAELQTELPPCKSRKLSTEDLSRSVSSPNDSAFGRMDGGFEEEDVPPPAYSPTETEKRLKAQLAQMSKLWEAEKSRREELANELSERTYELDKRQAAQIALEELHEKRLADKDRGLKEKQSFCKHLAAMLTEQDAKLKKVQAEHDVLAREKDRAVDEAIFTFNKHEYLLKQKNDELDRAIWAKQTAAEDLQSANTRANLAKADLEIVVTRGNQAKEDMEKDLASAKQVASGMEFKYEAFLAEQDRLIGPSMRKRNRRIQQLTDAMIAGKLQVPEEPKPGQRG